MFSTAKIATAGFNVASFGEDSAGEIYLADYAGRVLRLSSTQGTPATATSTPTKTNTATATSTSTQVSTPTETAIPTDLPDLRITGMRISIQFEANGCYTSTTLGTYVTLQNSGIANAGPFSVTLNNNLTLRVSNGLQPGKITSLWFASSNSDASATADSGNEVTESNETNNTATEFLPIPTLPPPCTTVTPTRTPTQTSTRTPTQTPTTTPRPISPRAFVPLVMANGETQFTVTPTPTATSSPARPPTDRPSGPPPTDMPPPPPTTSTAS